METLYERILRISKEQRFKDMTALCSVAGVPRAVMTDLKKGRTASVSVNTAGKLAAAMGVSVGYLLGTEEKEKPAENGGLGEYLTELRDRPETRALLEASRGMTKEQVEAMADFARRLRGTVD